MNLASMPDFGTSKYLNKVLRHLLNHQKIEIYKVRPLDPMEQGHIDGVDGGGAAAAKRVGGPVLARLERVGRACP